ncbi:MAG TPA: hypothetical protein VD905_00155 [Flavobacteriales bacterium]|nr:hypothetical protein [Flavobacteriales bacterium]
MKEVELYVNATGGPGFWGKVLVDDDPHVILCENRFFVLIEGSDKVYIEANGYVVDKPVKTTKD